jgi:hypothetical protein
VIVADREALADRPPVTVSPMGRPHADIPLTAIMRDSSVLAPGASGGCRQISWPARKQVQALAWLAPIMVTPAGSAMRAVRAAVAARPVLATAKLTEAS